MSRIRSGGTKPEMIVRRLCHRLGYRFRLHRKDLPGKPDLVFPSRHSVIFVHGCFWHQHTDPACLDGRLPSSREVYWHSKLRKNVERDTTNIATLQEIGWRVLVVWECETVDLDALAHQITSFLGVVTKDA